MKKFLILPLSFVMIMGCGTDEKRESDEQAKTKKVQETSKELTTPPVSKKALITGANSIKSSNRRSVSINKEKFTTVERELAHGSKVYNVSMREYGTLKSTVVIVGNVAKDKLTSHYGAQTVVKIAKDTYRLSPNAGLTVYEFYNGLLELKELTTVELEIDYSGSSIPTANY